MHLENRTSHALQRILKKEFEESARLRAENAKLRGQLAAMRCCLYGVSFAVGKRVDSARTDLSVVDNLLRGLGYVSERMEKLRHTHEPKQAGQTTTVSCVKR